MKNRKILIVTYYWPPSGGVGVQRWMNYALALQKEGWEPIIYTPQNPQFEIQDRSLLEKVKNIRVIKTKIWEPFGVFHALTGGKNKSQVKQGLVLEKDKKSLLDQLFIWIRGNLFVPDPRKYWVKPSVSFLREFLKKEEIDTIITTGPPHSMHLIGLGLKQELNLKWLADFRDPWSGWDVLDKLKTSAWAKRRHSELEKRVLEAADRVISVTQKLVESFNYKNDRTDGLLLYNGVSLDIQPPKPKSEELTIGHFGMLNELRNSPELWKALNEIGEDLAIQLKLGGIISENIKKEIESLESLHHRTEFPGYLSHEEVVRGYAHCDVLLLLQNQSENSASLLPLKFFEYLAASRWVLVLGPKDNDLAKMAVDLPTLRVVEPGDRDGIQEAIYHFQQSTPDFTKSHELYRQFTHEVQVKQLIEALENQDG